MSENAVLGEVQATVRGVIWIVAACTLAAAALAIVLSLAIVRPLGRLAAAADHVRDGRFPEALPVRSDDEVGRLAAAFNAMVAGRRDADESQAHLIAELQEALASVRLLQGMLPICASCKRVRDDKGYWNQIEAYLSTHSDVQFSHGLCPDCLKREYPQYAGKVGARLERSEPAGGSGG
jgi:HAMP domain-containing protein